MAKEEEGAKGERGDGAGATASAAASNQVKEGEAKPPKVLCGEHTDLGFLTLTFCAPVQGLQIPRREAPGCKPIKDKNKVCLSLSLSVCPQLFACLN